MKKLCKTVLFIVILCTIISMSVRITLVFSILKIFKLLIFLLSFKVTWVVSAILVIRQMINRRVA